MKRVTTHTIIFIVFIYFSASATIINIPDDYSTIQEGIDASSDGDTVLVAPGVYYENLSITEQNIILSSHFIIEDDTSFISATIIDGGASNSVLRITNVEDTSTAIIGFTIRNGIAVEGGGIYCENSSPRISHNIITDNESGGYYKDGGGIHLLDSSPTIEYNRITNNYAM